MPVINMDDLHVRVETVTPHDLTVGDIVWQHGARLKVLTKDVKPSANDPNGVVICITEVMNGGGSIPKPWQKDWELQGNSFMRVTREIMSIKADVGSVYTDEKGRPYN
jgi:hypothetical protein